MHATEYGANKVVKVLAPGEVEWRSKLARARLLNFCTFSFPLRNPLNSSTSSRLETTLYELQWGHPCDVVVEQKVVPVEVTGSSPPPILLLSLFYVF